MKNLMKIMLPIITLCFFQFSISAQSDEKPDREIGLNFSSLNNFGLVYKQQLKSGKYLRFDGTGFNAGIANNFDALNVGLRTNLTLENRKDISNKFFINHGWGVGLGANIAYNSNVDQTAINVAPSIHYLIGFQYRIGSSAYMGIELRPSISTGFSFNTADDNINYNLNINANTFSNINFMYQF